MKSFTNLAACAAGYMIGSLPFGLWLGRVQSGVYVREHGSGSMGTTNVLRVAGPKVAAATFALDVAKGTVAVGLARRLGATSSGQAGAGIAAVVGHSWPMFAHFRGGKSVATAFGGLLAITPEAAAWSVVGGGTALVTTRIVSVGSLCAASSATLAAVKIARRQQRFIPLVFAASVTAIIVVRHSENLKRLAAGTEPRLSLDRRRSKP